MTLMHPQHPMNTGKPWPREIIDPTMIPTNSCSHSLPIGRTNQAPRPEGFQRAVTGLADYITGNKWDFDQRGRGGQRQWNAPDDLTVTQSAEEGVREVGEMMNNYAQNKMSEEMLRGQASASGNSSSYGNNKGWNKPLDQIAHGGVLGRIGEFLGRLGVNQDYEDGVMRDSSGGRLYPNPYGEGNVHEDLYNNERWHQEQMRKLRPQ